MNSGRTHLLKALRGEYDSYETEGNAEPQRRFWSVCGWGVVTGLAIVAIIVAAFVSWVYAVRCALTVTFPWE
jgi:hypothetical protein